MRKRIQSITALLTVCFVLLPAQKPKGMKPGVERWPIKTSAHNMQETPRVISFDSLIALSDPPGVKKNDSRFQDAFIPSFHNSAGLHEGETVRVSGWLHLIAYETDGDYHIQISNSETSGDHCLIVEVPYPTYVKSAPNLKKLCAAVRSYIKKKILANKEPGTSGTVIKKAVYVTVTGQLFYDDSHVGDVPRGKRGMHAATLWELHPVTGIDLAKIP
jgi:hypothetical protein